MTIEQVCDVFIEFGSDTIVYSIWFFRFQKVNNCLGSSGTHKEAVFRAEVELSKMGAYLSFNLAAEYTKFPCTWLSIIPKCVRVFTVGGVYSSIVLGVTSSYLQHYILSPRS